jgi:hypothetical protein
MEYNPEPTSGYQNTSGLSYKRQRDFDFERRVLQNLSREDCIKRGIEYEERSFYEAALVQWLKSNAQGKSSILSLWLTGNLERFCEGYHYSNQNNCKVTRLYNRYYNGRKNLPITVDAGFELNAFFRVFDTAYSLYTLLVPVYFLDR